MSAGNGRSRTEWRRRWSTGLCEALWREGVGAMLTRVRASIAAEGELQPRWKTRADGTLGAQLRLFRLRAGLSQEVLAQRAGVGVATLAALERDERQRPHPRTLATLAKTLGLTPAECNALLRSHRADPGSRKPTFEGRRIDARPQPGRSAGWRQPVVSATQESTRHELLSGLSSLIGREQELADVLGLLRTARLVTLTGAGGVGKTRLALAVAAARLQSYPDGVLLSVLAPIADPALVPQAVAAAIGVPERGRRSLMTTLTEALRDRRALLVLDNCEHLIQASAELVDALLQQCPELTVLATSREALGLTRAVTWRVPSLGLPPAPPTPPAQLSQYEA